MVNMEKACELCLGGQLSNLLSPMKKNEHRFPQVWVVDGTPQPLLGCQQRGRALLFVLMNLIFLQYLFVCVFICV